MTLTDVWGVVDLDGRPKEATFSIPPLSLRSFDDVRGQVNGVLAVRPVALNSSSGLSADAQRAALGRAIMIPYNQVDDFVALVNGGWFPVDYQSQQSVMVLDHELNDFFYCLGIRSSGDLPSLLGWMDQARVRIDTSASGLSAAFTSMDPAAQSAFISALTRAISRAIPTARVQPWEGPSEVARALTLAEQGFLRRVAPLLAYAAHHGPSGTLINEVILAASEARLNGNSLVALAACSVLLQGEQCPAYDVIRPSDDYSEVSLASAMSRIGQLTLLVDRIRSRAGDSTSVRLITKDTDLIRFWLQAAPTVLACEDGMPFSFSPALLPGFRESAAIRKFLTGA